MKYYKQIEIYTEYSFREVLKSNYSWRQFIFSHEFVTIVSLAMDYGSHIACLVGISRQKERERKRERQLKKSEEFVGRIFCSVINDFSRARGLILQCYILDGISE